MNPFTPPAAPGIATDTNAFDLSETRLLITGAAGGIGTATARLCSRLGARLVLSDVANMRNMEELAHTLSGVQSVHLCDLSARDAVERMIAGLPDVSALADTSGICPFDDDWMAPDWNEQAFMRVMRVNLLGPINLARALLPGMIRRRYGRMALCGSIAGWFGGLRAGPHYAASKGGVHALVRWLSQRGAPHGVTVNGVAPGPVLTGMTTGHGYQASDYPMQRMGQPAEIAAMLAFLCAPGASYVSGAVLDVNGGTYLR